MLINSLISRAQHILLTFVIFHDFDASHLMNKRDFSLDFTDRLT